MTVTKKVKKGLIQNPELDLIIQIIVATGGDYKLALDLIAFRQIDNSIYYVNGLGQVATKIVEKMTFLPIIDKGDRDDDEKYVKGYQQVYIENSKPYVHRLVTTNFLKNTTGFEKAEVNHKDSVKYHNNIWNLEWCSTKHNNEHMQVFKKIKKNKLNGYVYTKLDLENYISLKEFNGKYFYLEKENIIYLVIKKKGCKKKVLYVKFKEQFEQLKKILLEEGVSL